MVSTTTMNPATTTLNDLHRSIRLLPVPYLLAGVVVVILAQRLYSPVRKVFSPLRLLPGPRSKNILWGRFKDVIESPNLVIFDEWAKMYGPIYAYRGLFSTFRLIALDIRALLFVMSQTESFHKPGNVRQGVSDFLGKGLLFVESDAHRRQRRIMNPSFGSPHIRALLPVFWQKATRLKDVVLNTAKSGSEAGVEINVLPLISHTTLDTIGVAGFDYHFNSLDESGDELAAAFTRTFEAPIANTLLTMLNRFVPGIRFVLPDEQTRLQNESSAIMRRIGTKIIQEKKASLNDEVKTGSAAQGRDLLTLLIKSNMTPENEGQAMSDDEVLAQITTFLFAGHETTSLSTTWALYALTQHPEVQRKLRHELLDSGLGDEPSMADLDKLRYLDHVVHEVLRLYPAVPASVREAVHDVHVPVSGSFRDQRGVERSSFLVQKGDMVILPVVVMNRRKEIWGEDSMEFRPERWDNLPEAVKEMPGVWGHLMTFIHGARSCIGYRFAVAELKVLLYTLVRAIEFDMDPSIQVECKMLSARPLIVGYPEKGHQMPLICKPMQAV